MTRYIAAVKQYLNRRGKLFLPLVLVVCTLAGGLGITFLKLSAYEGVIFFQVILLLILFDFSWFVIKNFGDFSYKIVFEKEATKFAVGKSDLKRKNIDKDGVFVPRALYAKSDHFYEIVPLGAKLLTTFQEFRRSENSALKWRKLDVEGMEGSFYNDRGVKSHDYLKVIEYSVNLIKSRVLFNPPIESKEGVVKYGFTRKYFDAQFLTREDIAKALELGCISETRPFCIQGRRISVETDKLHLSVQFPHNYNATKFSPRVTNQGEIISSIQDQLTVIETRENEFIRAELEISKHLIKVGYVYSIIWLPPSIKDIN